MKKHGTVLKEFGPAGLKVREMVAEGSSLKGDSLRAMSPTDIFCLRIDADEYTPGSFGRYYRLFKSHGEAITIFFNVFSFKDAREEILRCRDLGLDVQSHAFYHYTYSDYASNRHNINKAKKFFEEIGIEPKGFVAPYGRWNPSLQCALEDEGYEYSSEFSYDYMSFPSYPSLRGRRSNVLQIPVFPVAPELFYQNGRIDLPRVKEYFIKAIDEMVRCGLPVIIYAHTDPTMPDIPELLEDIAAYAISVKGLKPMSMSGISDRYRNGETLVHGAVDRIPSEDFLGRPCRQSMPTVFKEYLKTALDFERITPSGELKCAPLKKMLKLLARKVCAHNS